MKKIAVLMVLVLAMGGAAFAVDNVAGTAHNLAPITSETTEICVFCHTPHKSEAGGPLWNRATDNTGYTMYSSATIDMAIATAPQGGSLACMSCHDGTITYDTLINAPGSGGWVEGGVELGWTITGGSLMTGLAALGKDLSSEHPVSITYDNSAAGDTAFRSIGDATISGIQFFGGSINQVECGSCHKVHDDSLEPFLRVTNEASAMCLACHIK